MTGTLANAAEEPVSLDPPTLSTNLEDADAILCVAELHAEERAKARFSIATPKEPASSLHGFTLATLCSLHLAEMKLATRGAILAKGISTKSDAIAALDLVAELGDGELTDHLLAGLRSFLLVD